MHTPRSTPRGNRLSVSGHCYGLESWQLRICHAPLVDLLLHNHLCGEAGSHCLLLLEADCDTMLEIADEYGPWLAAVSGAILESTNYILRKGYKEHSSKGGGGEECGGTGSIGRLASLGMVVSNL